MTYVYAKNLSGVAETLLVTLYLRAMESRRPDTLIKDEKAVELDTRMSRVPLLAETTCSYHF